MQSNMTFPGPGDYEMEGIKNLEVLGKKGTWIPPNLAKTCQYHMRTADTKSPHSFKPRTKKEKILPNVLHAIGETPLIRLNRIPQELGIEAEVVAKCEFMNPGGSLKDRIALRMIEDAEEDGRLRPGGVIVEPTSGNTGIGLGMVASVKGYRMIAVMPEKNSNEKVYTMRAEGVELVRTPSIASFYNPESAYRIAYKLHEVIPNSVVLDQYRCASNALAHYDTTAEEILEACNGHLDMLVVGTGTGGTITGLERKIKEKCPNCKVIGVDPLGSQVAYPKNLNVKGSTNVEGIGKDFVPTVCDRRLVDKFYKAHDKESFRMARKIIKEEGLLAGGSSGAVLHYAMQAAKDFGMTKGHRIVVVFADSIRNYMTKFLNDDWMKQQNILDEESVKWWHNKKVTELELQTPETVQHTMTIKDVVAFLRKQPAGQDQALVVKEGIVQGMVTLALLLAQLKKGNLNGDDQIGKLIYSRFKTATVDATLKEISDKLDLDSFVVIYEGQEVTGSVVGLATSVELISYLTNSQEKKKENGVTNGTTNGVTNGTTNGVNNGVDH